VDDDDDDNNNNNDNNSIQFNSVLRYLCADKSAIRQNTETAQQLKKNADV
jgi:hypothetical protein